MISRARRGRRLGRGCLSAGFCLGLVAAAAAGDDLPSSAASPAAPGIAVELSDELLTLHAEGAPLAVVLRAIGEAGGFRVVLRGTFATPVREVFADQPIEDAIRHLVEGHSLIVRHDEPDPQSNASVLAEIRVIENPALVTADETAADGPLAGGEGALEEGAPEDDGAYALSEREAFRLANRGVPPPTRENILLELDEPDQTTRVAAIPKVGALPPGAATEVLAGVFAAEDDALVRSRAVAALTRLDAPGARGLLRARALGDDDPELRMQALNALASSRGERAVNLIAEALRNDPEPAVRLSAIRAFGRIGGDWAQSHLRRATSDDDPAISAAAEQALAAWPPQQ